MLGEFHAHLISLFYAMAKEDCYGRPETADGMKFLWVHNSEDGWLDYLVVKIDHNEKKYFFENQYSIWNGGPVDTNNFTEFLVGILKACEDYKTLNPDTLEEIKKEIKNRKAKKI